MGFFQAGILEWVATSFSRESSWPRNWTPVSCITGRFFYCLKVKVKVTQSCPTLCDPRDYAVCGFLQSWVLELVDFPFSRGFSQHKAFHKAVSATSICHIYVCVCVCIVWPKFWWDLRDSLVAQLLKNPPTMQETSVWSLGWENPWRREWLPTPVFWLEYHGLHVDYRVGHDWVTFTLTSGNYGSFLFCLFYF